MISDNEIGGAGDSDDALLDVTAVAKRFNISKRSVHRMVARGQLSRAVKIGRCARWFEADVLAVIKRLLGQRKRGGER